MSNFAYIVRALLKRGPLFPFLYARESLVFDLLYGTNTHLRVPKLYQPGTETERKDGVLYVASWTNVVRRALALSETVLGEKRFREAQFFDLGCGKGKALLVYAMQYGPRVRQTAVGIDYDRGLCEIAEKNILRLGPGPSRVAVHCDSALNIENYIKAEILIVYLYNPFQGDTLRATLNRIAKHPHVLIYVDPVEKHILSDYGYKICAFHQGRYHADTWLLALNQISGQPPQVDSCATG